MRNFLKTVSCLLASGALAIAESDVAVVNVEQSEAVKGELIKTSISLIGLELDREDAKVFAGDAEFAVRTSTIAKPVSYEGSSELVLRAQAGGDVLARASLLDGCSEQIVLLYPSVAGEGEKYQTKVLKTTGSDLPLGSRMLVNLSESAVQGVTGPMPFKEGSEKNIEFKVPAGGQEIIAAVLENAPALTAMPVLIKFQEGEQWRPLMEGRWFHQPKKRLIMVFSDRQKGQAPRIKAFVGRP